MAVNKVKLHICGTEYVVSSENSEGMMRELGAQLDADMRALLDANGRVSLTMAAVLTALNYADGVRHANAASEHLRGQMMDYLDARRDVERLRQENARLQRELESRRTARAATPAPIQPVTPTPIQPQTPADGLNPLERLAASAEQLHMDSDD